MKKLFTFIFGIMFFCMSLFAQQDTVRSLIISEVQEQAMDYVELTNVGTDSVDLSRFTWQAFNNNAYKRWVFDGQGTYLGSPVSWSGGPVKLSGDYWNSLPDMPAYLKPGESIVMNRVKDAVNSNPQSRNYGQTRNRPGMLNVDAVVANVHYPDGVDTLFPYRPELEMWGFDSLSTVGNGDYYYRITIGAVYCLFYHLAPGDSVLVDQIKVIDLAAQPDANDVAGVYNGLSWYHLVRKADVKSGTWDWNLSRGIDSEDSQWLVLPQWNTWHVPTTVGTHGDFGISLSSSTVTINQTDTTITVPWGIYKGDSILDEFTFGPGMSWHYTEDSVDFADSAFVTVQDGDILTVYACGNSLEMMDFEVIVADPSEDMALVFPKRKFLPPEVISEPDYAGPLWGLGTPYYVTENNPVIDTIGDVPFACRVDSLLKYLDKAPAATWEIEYVDGKIRADLKYGDKLVVTAQNGTTKKEYFIKALKDAEYLEFGASHISSLSTIIWPDIPGFLDGWKGDTIPLFSSYKTSYQITLPEGTTEIPSLQAIPYDLNARIVEERATLLRGATDQRTTTYTVFAEDDSSKTEYSVIFSVEKPMSKRQLYRAEPIWSEFNNPRFIGTGGAREVANVGDVPLDLSNYMLAGGLYSTPADMIRAIAGVNFARRYHAAIVPGFKYYDDETVWGLNKGILLYDSSVDPVVEPGDVFVVTVAARDAFRRIRTQHFFESIYAESDIIPNYDKSWLLPGAYNLNTWNLTNVWNMGTWFNRLSAAIFKIENDSILEGTKAIGDPEDFDLIDRAGDPLAPKWTDCWYEYKQMQNPVTNERQRQFIRRPENVFPNDDYLDTLSNQTGWLARSNEYYADARAALGVDLDYFIVSDVGTHNFVPVSIHMSTVSSVTYLASDGYKSPQTIQGDLSGTTLSELLGNIYKANPDQSLKLLSGTDGMEISANDPVAGGDTLVVVSADTTNTTNYLLVNEPLDDNTMLTVKSAYTNLYSITVDDNEGTITGMGILWGKALKDVMPAFTKPATANLNIVDQNGKLLSSQVTNYDTVPTDVQLHDSIFVEVVAQDGVTKMMYRFVPAAMASDAFVISSFFLVDQDNLTISLIPEGISVAKFLENVQAVTGATATLMGKYGSERKIGLLTLDDKLKVVSQDGTKTVYYYLNFFNEMEADYNLPPSLSVAFSDTNIVINTTISMVAMAEDDDMPLPTNLSVLWEVLSGDAGSVTIASSDQLTTDVSFTALGSVVLQVTVDDGEISKSATVNVGVVSPNNIAPTIAVAFADTTIAEGTTISVGGTADDDGNPIGSSLSYAWTVTLGNAANVSIATADQLTSDVTFSTPGVYSLKVTVSDGEAVASGLIVVVVTSTLSVEPVMVPGLNMYPNPASQQLTLELLNTGDISSTVKIFGITGRAVYNAEHMQSKIQIDVRDFDAGVYFVAVKSGDYSVTRKLQIIK